MTKLSQLITGRDNNLNLIRIIAALSVLVSHSFAIVTGDSSTEPLRSLIGFTPGTMAVDVFFVTSGLLLTNSLVKKGDIYEFILSRIARIYPALLFAVFLTAYVMGPAFTTLTLKEYLSSNDVFIYFIKTATLLRGVGFVLPKVFIDNPLYAQVNGSLWTLPYEIKMYILLFFIWYLCVRVLKKWNSEKTLQVAILALTCGSGFFYFFKFVNADLNTALHSISRFIYFFFLGSCLSVFQKNILISPRILLSVISILLVSSVNKSNFFFCWNILMPYAIVLLAYQLQKSLSWYNTIGDYSYGIYIYAFPVQQSVIFWIKDISISNMILYSSLITFGFSFLSWHLIENPIMKRKVSYLKSIKIRKKIKQANINV